MGIFKFFSSQRPKRNSRKTAQLNVEALEDRFLPSCNVISGFVYHDANNDGIYQQGVETPVANSTIELRNAQNVVVGHATTDANGFYSFDHDETINSAPATLTRTFVIDDTQTNFTISGLVDQFDPNLGSLQSVEIIFEGAITSEIKVENTSTVSGSNISGTVSGTMNLSGPNVNLGLAMSTNAGSVNASAYDGLIDFDGASGETFVPKKASDTKSITLTGSNMNPYIGTGQVTFTDVATATSTANGGGNLVVQLNSTAAATVTVKYRYLPNVCLEPGDYTIVQTQQPAGFFDGKESSAGVVLNTPPGSDTIPVTLGSVDLLNNNFGEIKAASLSGFVYHDINNNGIKDGPELGIANVPVVLTGTDDFGNAVNRPATTNVLGYYEFLNLRPGTYTVVETQPASHLDGKDAIGSIPGDPSVNDQFSAIQLGSGSQSVNNNFGEVLPLRLSGYVYVDANNNGIKEGNEQGINNVQLTLTGSDDVGPVSQPAVTNALGFYEFTNLRPGTYTITETHPSAYLDGKDTIGTQGGAGVNDALTTLPLLSGIQGLNNNFGELVPAALNGYVYLDNNDNGIKEGNEAVLPNVEVRLTGIDDLGIITPRSAFTNAAGKYEFLNLRPGAYTVTEVHPSGYTDGKDTIGSVPGNTTMNDQFSAILLGMGVISNDNNFGEIRIEKADLGIVKTVSPPSVLVGNQFIYTLTITNYGDFTAQNVVVVDTLPVEVSFLSVSGAGWTFTRVGNTVTGTLPSLAVNAQSQISITVQAPIIPGVVNNVSTVTSSTQDDNPNNNRSEVPTLIYNQPGDGWPKTLPPLMAQGTPVIISKAQLFARTSGWQNGGLVGQMIFVDGLSRSFLGRPADYNTQTSLAYQLQAGSISREQLAAMFYDSNENRANQTNNLYQTFFHRFPTATEQAQVISQLRSGVSELDIARNLLLSAEYAATHPTSGALLAGFYADVLGRVPDLSSQLVELQTLNTNDRTAMISSLFTKPEIYQQIVEYSFASILRRPPTGAELQFWAGQLQNRLITPGQLMIKLIGSGDFFSLVLTTARLI